MEKIPVYFAPEMVVDADYFSPSAGKPVAVVERFKSLGLPIEMRKPRPVGVRALTRAHDARYVRDVLCGKVSNGFGDNSKSVAESLLWTSGSMLSAARSALESGGAACAPCSGFHHAHFGSGGGFCTFNGLMVTAFALREDGLVKRVGILDFDFHYGDGTENIIARHGASDWIEHFTAGAIFNRREHALKFLANVPRIVEGMASRCDLILYQAGADPHISDPLGGFLTTKQLARRDWLVFNAAKVCNVPIAWNLAGGYQRDASGGIEPVLQIHENTMRACARAFVE